MGLPVPECLHVAGVRCYENDVDLSTSSQTLKYKVVLLPPMTSQDNRCLRCAEQFDYDDGECPSCGWSSAEFRSRNRYNLARSGTGEWDQD